MFCEEYYTERLKLVLSDVKLAEQVAEFEDRNKEFYRDVEPIREKEYYTTEYQRNILLNDIYARKNGTNLKYWLMLKENNRLVGMIAFNNIVRGPFQSCFLGYSIDHEMVNRGLMTEAVEKAVQIAFEDLHLHRIEANIMPKNIASLKVVSKLNFVNEGTARKYLNINGIWEDHIHMVRINDSY